MRFIYLHPLEHYLQLDQPRDVIEKMSGDHTFDVAGWDLAKLLGLLHSSNPTIFEWDASPICYRISAQWGAVREILPTYFSPKRAAFHYLSMARTNEKAYLRQNKVKLKKYFYVLRPVLACRWVLDTGTPPPMLFTDLADSLFPTELRGALDDLLARKTQAMETDFCGHILELDAYCQENLVELHARAESSPSHPTPGWGPLNEVFITLVQRQ